ncbi:MAG: adenylate/guanylate cyclase domain-containing protein [Thermodesulfobacteriota bacterium]
MGYCRTGSRTFAPMRCASCQRESPADDVLCAACGMRLVLRCARCGRSNPVEHRFCGGCGRRLALDVTAGRDPRSHTPLHLVQRILTTRSALEGERKQVTVLFADVEGSLEVAERLELEAWHRILDRFFRILGAGVSAFDGTINQFTGDGIMALFGAPLAHEDHAERACHAALRLAGDLRDFARDVREQHDVDFGVRMGLNSGEVVVGKIGDDLRMDYTAQGHTVGVAARLQEIAAAGQIVISDETAALVRDLFVVDAIGELHVKGLRTPVRAHVLRAVGPLRTRLEVSRGRGLTGFVGRDDEMAILEAALGATLEGRGVAVGVVGAAGVGKSRLCQEFVERCRARSIPVIEAHCLSHARNAPLGVLRDLLRDALSVGRDADPELARDRIARGLVELDPALRDAVPLAQDVMAVPDPRSPEPAADPAAKEEALATLLRLLLRARGARGAFVVHLDDAHWIDLHSERLFARVVDVASTTRALLLLNFRPEFHAPWMERSFYRQVPVAPLGESATCQMITSLLGDDPSVAGLGELIRDRTQGNPFFIEEVVRALDASGAVAGERGSYRWTRATRELGVPATVQSLLAARVDGLAERDKLVLQSASVIGKRFSRPVLARVAGLPAVEITASLAALERAEFVHAETESDYAFRHPLTQEVAYASQLLDGRITLHAAVARALEDVFADRLGEHAGVIAHHWEQAQKPAQAYRWRRLAALRVTRIQPRRPQQR